MADIIMKIQQDKMALILILDVFGSFSMQIDAALASESMDQCICFFIPIYKISLRIYWQTIWQMCAHYCFTHSQMIFH